MVNWLYPLFHFMKKSRSEIPKRSTFQHLAAKQVLIFAVISNVRAVNGVFHEIDVIVCCR